MRAMTVDGLASAGSDMLYKTWIGQTDQITMMETTKSLLYGVGGAIFGTIVSARKFPNRNFPPTPGYKNPVTNTIREMPYRSSEFYDAKFREINAMVNSSIFSFNIQQGYTQRKNANQ